MKRILVIIMMMAVLFSGIPTDCFAAGNSAEAMYEEGMEFFEKEDYDRAFARFQIAGEVRGYAPAQNMLGICYRDGLGAEKDLDEAVKYFSLSVDQEYAPAQENLADMKKALEEEQNKEAVAERLTSQVPEIVSLSLDEQNNPVVSWVPVEGAEQYQIIRIGKNHRRFVLTVNPDTTSYPIKSCQEGQEYSISVRARFEFNMEKGAYAYSEESEAWTIRIPERKTDESAEVSDYISSSEQKEETDRKAAEPLIGDYGVSEDAPVITNTRIGNWNYPVIEFESSTSWQNYELFRSEAIDGEYSFFQSTGSLSKTFTFTGKVGKTYYYKVRGKNVNGEVSQFSNIVSITIPNTYFRRAGGSWSGEKVSLNDTIASIYELAEPIRNCRSLTMNLKFYNFEGHPEGMYYLYGRSESGRWNQLGEFELTSNENNTRVKQTFEFAEERHVSITAFAIALHERSRNYTGSWSYSNTMDITDIYIYE